MDLIIVFVILAVVAVVVAKVLFWLFIGRVVMSAGRNAEAEFTQMMQQLDAAVRAAQHQSTAGGQQAQLPPDFALQLMQARNQFARMDELTRQRHETNVAGMLSDASAAGIDVSGWNR